MPRSLEFAGCIVTLDAMGCQKQIAREIIEADADYVLAPKGNQPAAHEEISAFLDDAIERKEPALDYWETVEKGHGRLETRRYWQSDRIGWFAGKEAWESLRSVGVVEAVREIDGKISVERRYHLSRLPLDAQRFWKAVRSYWGGGKSSSTGCSTSSLTRTKAAPGTRMPGKTSPRCADGAST